MNEFFPKDKPARRFPPTLDFIPAPPLATREAYYKEKIRDINLCRKRGVEIAEKYNKTRYEPSKAERGWIFYDSLITMHKEDYQFYYDDNKDFLEENYPWEICHWLKNWYSIHKYLRLVIHKKLEEDDGILFFSIARPLPPEVIPPNYEVQQVSFYKIISNLHSLQEILEEEKAIKGILSNPELLSSLIKGEVIPYKFTEVLNYNILYDRVTNKLFNHPEIVKTLAPGTQKAIENLRLTVYKTGGNSKVLQGAPWLIEAIKMQKEGATEAQLYDYLMEDAPKEEEEAQD